ncbi:structural maintenance of chromosomes protein 5 [Drosophila willistoni]|uniref:structural maintenance of chromosomes protein 5 n=1 Tax=Drosophila willistoni TaxID=7260 RepID=UPI000C26D8D1|nr:structural maintenance of chromosomes protein 5 [Drosophila willistoni]
MADNGIGMIGRIKTVYCKDFVSYNEIAYCPKKYLNVLTGPNGTGKSTIVSAIILGFGGEPQLLNRSSSISDYIQSNKTQATIIIEIYGRGENEIDTFRRTINQTGPSKYAINDKDVSKKAFLAFVSTYNIQVSNLCQFLPQDRVQDFSKMNPQELLVNTMSSVCDTQLLTAFEQLKEMRSQQLNAHANCDQEKDNLQKKEKRLEQLQMSVAQYRDREELLQKCKVFTAKKLWIMVKTGEDKYKQYEIDMKTLKANYEKSEKTYKMHVRASDQIIKKTSKFREQSLQMTNQLMQSTTKKTELETQLSNIKRGIREKLMDMERNIRLATKNVDEVKKIANLISTKEYELEQFNEIKPDLLDDLENRKTKIISTRQIAIGHYNKRKELESTINEEKIPEISALRNKIERLQNVKSQKQEEISRKNPNLFKAMNWLAQNRQQYNCTVYDPMILELNMANDDEAKYLENVIPYRDLYAFSCEDKSVMSQLINELCVKQKLSVNIIYCEPVKVCSFKPTVPLDKLRHMGFHGYLVDKVSGPAAILNKLCSTYRIHNIPIGGEEVANFTSMVPKSIRVYFGGNKRFSVTTSRYSDNTIISEQVISGKNLLMSVDSKQLSALQKRYKEVVFEQDSMKNKLSTSDREFERLQLILREEGEGKKKIEQKLLHFKNLESEVQGLKRKSNDLEKSVTSKGELKSRFRKYLIIETKKMLDLESKLIDKLKIIKGQQLEKKIIQTKETVHKMQHENQAETLKESEDCLRKARSSVEKLMNSVEAQKREIERKMNEIGELCNGKIPTNRDFPFKQQFNEMQDFDLEQVSEAMHDIEARLECMKSINAETITQYEQLQAEVNQLKEKIYASANQGKTVESRMNVIYDQWEPKLLNLIDGISSKFSDFMESIDYVGEVVLTKADKYDFGSYGIQIMVQYRKDAQLQMLDKYVQSGGERAVAIAIYSLSLQHITHVPFRCVDEINQGMDSTNERRIFDLLLKEATKEGSSQYIFVTPKLLRDLNYNDRLCVSIVHNSKTIQIGTSFPLS